MRPIQSTVQVRVSEGVLWVGGEAYPLRYISRVGLRALEVDRRSAWKKWILHTLSCLVFGGGLAAFAGTIGAAPLVGVEALLVWRLITTINKPALYSLVVNTSGTQHDAVWSTDRDEIQYLIGEITKAIGDPDIRQVTYNVQHALQGDLIQQYGSGIIGKAQHSGSGNIVAADVQRSVRGDRIQQYGSGSIGKAEHSSSGNIVAAEGPSGEAAAEHAAGTGGTTGGLGPAGPESSSETPDTGAGTSAPVSTDDDASEPTKGNAGAEDIADDPGSTLPRLSGQVHRNDAPSPPLPPVVVPSNDVGSMEPRSLVAELAEQTSPGREVPLHVQIVRGNGRGVQLRSFPIPRDGARVMVTIHAPGLVVIDELQQELHVVPGRDSDVLRFRLKGTTPGLHQVTVRAFRGGTFLGDVTCQISVGYGSVTRDGPQRHALLPSMAFDPGEVTLQVLRDEAAGTFSFQLISETFYAPEIFHFKAGDPRQATEQIYSELRRAAKTATTGGADGDALRLRDRLRNHGVQLWTSAVPQAVQRQFWDEADQVTAFTVLGEHDIVPWELLYPLNEGREDRGFLAEWLPVVRRVFGQDRVRSISMPRAAFVVPPGSPADAGEEVTSLRARLGSGMADASVLTERVALTALIEGGHAGLLHFACHNAFTGAGSCVTMADGPFDPIDLASAAQLRTLRPHRPLVFFNACRSAGEIDWFGESLGWAPQFLNAGAGAFVGTLWPVRSRSALQFAEAFYDQLITHRQPLGQASLAARQAIRDLHGGDPTWLAYAVYGSPAATAHTTT